MKYTLAQKLKKYRKKLNYSQKELAKRSGVPFYTIVALENDRSKVPMITTVKKLAKTFKVSIDEMIKDIQF